MKYPVLILSLCLISFGAKASEGGISSSGDPTPPWLRCVVQAGPEERVEFAFDGRAGSAGFAGEQTWGVWFERQQAGKYIPTSMDLEQNNKTRQLALHFRSDGIEGEISLNAVDRGTYFEYRGEMLSATNPLFKNAEKTIVCQLKK